MNVRILNNQLAYDLVVATVVPADAGDNTLATFQGESDVHAVGLAWDWADANGHVVVEA